MAVRFPTTTPKWCDEREAGPMPQGASLLSEPERYLPVVRARSEPRRRKGPGQARARGPPAARDRGGDAPRARAPPMTELGVLRGGGGGDGIRTHDTGYPRITV